LGGERAGGGGGVELIGDSGAGAVWGTPRKLTNVKGKNDCLQWMVTGKRQAVGRLGIRGSKWWGGRPGFHLAAATARYYAVHAQSM